MKKEFLKLLAAWIGALIMTTLFAVQITIDTSDMKNYMRARARVRVSRPARAARPYRQTLVLN